MSAMPIPIWHYLSTFKPKSVVKIKWADPQFFGFRLVHVMASDGIWVVVRSVITETELVVRIEDIDYAEILDPDRAEIEIESERSGIRAARSTPKPADNPLNSLRHRGYL